MPTAIQIICKLLLRREKEDGTLKSFLLDAISYIIRE